jgi:hypothetical protein
MSDEILDAESSTLNKNLGPIDHLRHLLKIGWEPKSPLIQSFIIKYGLERELKQILDDR